MIDETAAGAPAPAAPAPAPAASGSVLTQADLDAIAQILAQRVQPPTAQLAAADVLQVAQALASRQPAPQAQSRALGLMAVAAVVGGLNHVLGVTPDGAGPWLDGLSMAFAWIATAIGDFRGALPVLKAKA